MAKPERFSASVASKHLACHASANLELAIPGYDLGLVPLNTKASSKGTDIHQILEDAGKYTPREMAGIAQGMAYVAELRKQRRFKTLLEADGNGWWLTGKPRTKADVVLYVADEIHVVDYKFGRIPVHPQGNSQGMYYSAAFLPLAPKAKGVTFHIVQPFVDNIDETFFTRNELEEFMDETAAADAAIQQGSTRFSPGDHCQFCSANPHSRGGKAGPYCPAMMQVLYPSTIDEDAILDTTD